ncbi:MAG: hypothetical protein D3916_03680 [Candidatus Electrothrix sp. MAN1_4]|nr:hypothetical protein [Candidatus Electrothrix sp. MAN1_4]
MTFDVALLGLGTLLLLVGLLGKIEAEKLTLGTKSRIARIVSGVLGVLFLTVALSPHIGYGPSTKARDIYWRTVKRIAVSFARQLM